MIAFFKALPLMYKLIIIVIIIIAIILIVNYIKKQIKKKKANELIEKNYAQTGTGQVVNIGAAASSIWGAFHDDWWQEDEELAMSTLLNVPRELVPKLKDTYFEIEGKTLTEEFRYYLSASQYAIIKNHLE